MANSLVASTSPSLNRPVASWPLEERLGATLRRALPKLAPEVRRQLEGLLSPQALAIMAGVLVAWVASHAIGLGELIDLVLLAVGVVSVGWSVFSGIDHLYDFAAGTYRARAERDLDAAAEHLAKAIAILGIQAVLAVLFRGAKAPRTGQGGRLELDAPPPRTPGARYKPAIREDATFSPGEGLTTWWGDISVSTQGSNTERAVVLLHEKVHQFMTPRLYLLRNYRVENRAASYVRSSLWRYLEEALAETIGQLGAAGFTQAFKGVRFPVENGYMYLMKPGGYAPDFTGHGLIPEAAALLRTGAVAGIPFELRFQHGAPPAMCGGAP